jgi:hypothetical protein
MSHAADHPHLKKNQCDRKAASHPLPVLLNLPFENEDHRNPGSNHPQRGVQLDPDFSIGYANLAMSYMAIQRLDEAENTLQRGLRSSSPFPRCASSIK